MNAHDVPARCGPCRPARLVPIVALVLALGMMPAHAAPPGDPTEARLAACLDDPLRASTAGQTECETAALQAFDRRMNAAYATLRGRLPAPAADRLRTSQRAWIAYRDAEAATRQAIYATRRGTMFVPMEDAAATAITADRAHMLERYARALAIEP